LISVKRAWKLAFISVDNRFGSNTTTSWQEQ